MNDTRKWVVAVSWVLCCLMSSLNDSRAADIGTPVSITVGTLPDDAAIIYFSTRNQFQALGPSDLYVANLTGGNVTRMTFSAKTYEHAVLSFDRRYIVCNRYLNGGPPNPSSVWIIDLKNRTEARLVPSHYSSGGGGLDWSPDGFIYFASQQVSGGAYNIFKIKPDGTQLTQLTFLVVDPFSEPPDPAGVSDVSVSDDGSKVAYVRILGTLFPNGAWGPDPQVWVMNADGTDQHLLYEDGRPGGVSGNDIIGVYDPEFSPDGQKVAFSQTNLDYFNFPPVMNTAHDIFTINTDGTGLVQVTSVGPVSIIPDWQNGRILYTEYWDSNAIGSGTDYTGPVLINPDGTGKTRLESGLEIFRGGRHGKFIRPTTNATSCSGQWSNCSRAFTNDTARATASATPSSPKTGTWNNYGFSLPANATVHSVTVLANFYASNSAGQIEVRVSGDGGATYGPAHVVGGNTSEQTFLIDVTADRAWTESALSNASFRVQVKFFKTGSSSSITGNLRWVPVKVSYTP